MSRVKVGVLGSIHYTHDGVGEFLISLFAVVGGSGFRLLCVPGGAND